MLLDQFSKGRKMKTEQLSGAVQVAWYQDGDLARIYFDDFGQEYERTSKGNVPTFKLRNTSCKELVVIKLRGYSQGDFAIVKTTKENDTPEYRKYLNNIFWDTPICARVCIVGTDDEWYIDENYDDIYDASREAFNKAIEKTDMPADIKARVQILLGSQDYADINIKQRSIYYETTT